MKIRRDRNPSALAAFLAVAAVGVYSSTADAQDVMCRATKSSDGLFVGRCVQGDSLAGDITFRRPAVSAPYLWLGTIRGARFRSAASGGPVGESEIGLDIRGGVLRLGRSWLSVRDTRADGDELRFVFRFDRAEPASDVDVRILEKARAMLADESQWNRKDTTDMGAAPVKGFSCAPANRQSMFCAVYLSTLDIAGDYFHFRPAVNAVRQAVNDSSKRRYRHSLIDFNNDESVTLAEVHGVLDAALAAVRAERATRSACAKECLASLADQYLSALVANDPSRLPLAPSVRFTENGNELRLGEGLWRTAGSLGSYRVYVVDPDSGAIAVQTVLREGEAVVQLLVRLKATGGRIGEIEAIIARRGDTCCWAPERLNDLSRVFEQTLPPADRISRDEMVSIADSYFTALHTSGTPEYRRASGLTRATNRYENGMLTTNVPGGGRLLGSDAATQFDSAMFGQIRVVNRRYLAVDPENGTLLAIVVFESPNSARTPAIISEFFKIARAEIREIRAVMVSSRSSGWR